MLALLAFLLAYGAWQIFRWGGPGIQQAVGDAAFGPPDLLGVALAWRVARRRDLDRQIRRAWGFIGGALLGYMLDDVLQFVYEAVLHVKPYPSIANLCYLTFYPLMLVGMLQFPQTPKTRAGRAQVRLDAGALLLAGASVLWFVLLSPAALAQGQNPFEVLFSVAYPCGDLVLIFGLATLVVAKRRSFAGRPLALYSSSLLLFVIADLIYARMTLTGSYSGGDPVDMLWLVAINLIAVAASEFGRTTGVVGPRNLQAEPGDSTFLAYVTVGVTFSLMVASLVDGGTLESGSIAFSAAAIIAALARLQWVSIAKRRQGHYYRALVERVADYVVVLDAGYVPRYVSPPLLTLVGLPIDAIIDEATMPRFVLEEDLPLVFASLERASSSPGAQARAEVRLRDASGQILSVVGITTNLLDDPAVEGLVVVLHDITENSRLEAELRHQALHDALTGLPNRALIHDRLTQNLAAARRHASSVAVLYVDLDDFKDVNDSLGHGAGDELLQVVASRLDSIVRGEDTVGRVGGDEFVLLAGTDGNDDAATSMARRVLDVMEHPVELSSVPGKTLRIGASVGIAVGAAESPAELLRDADLAMYRAKTLGKNRFVVFEPEMYQVAAARLELETDLRLAFARGEYFLVYQPVVDLETLIPCGVEALLRWRHPRRGVVSPAEFVPLLEERGLIVEVGRWVLEQACVSGARWQGEGCPLVVNVNVSVLQLLDAGFVQDVRNALAASGFEPIRLVVEITESVLTHEPDRMEDVLTELKALGVRIAIDDFGTGYSSLTYLRRFPIDELKIDRSFVADMETCKESATVVRTLVHLGTELGIVTVAEGIEDAGQLAALRDERCDLGQGFVIAAPMPGESIPAYVDTTRMGTLHA